MNAVLTREEFIEHVKRLEAKLERFIARENPSRDELLDFIRTELTLRVLVTELHDLDGDELAAMINATPI